MPIEIIVPRLGWSMEEGLFAGWLKNHGDKVAIGEPLFALESDKVTMEVESLDSGVLQIPPDAPQPGGAVAVGQKLGYLLAEGEQPVTGAASGSGREEDPGTPAPSSLPQPPVSAAVSSADERRPVSARARALAKSLGLDLSQVVAAEGSKRVVEADVQRAYERLAATRPSPGEPAVASPVEEASKPSARARKVIAMRMEESFRTPHFYVHAEVDAALLTKVREEMLPIIEEQHHVRVTYNDLLVKAIATTLRAMPNLNCYWNEGEIVSRREVNVGLAVQANDTLLVPVIRDADRLSLAQIAVFRREIVEKCRRSDVKLTDFEGGSVTLSNLGPFGVDRFQAILNPPQSAIIAVGRVAKRPFVDGNEVVARLTMPISISVDHRVVDGVAAARFLSGIVQLLQSPLRLVVPPVSQTN
jgi:pyruvate dehydrogenase E2 component (dihydrolipoamide acetyltransferase)